MPEKKRDLLSKLNVCIITLTKMSADAAQLEIVDNDQASRRLKRSLAEFKHKELLEFTNAILEVRGELRERPKRAYKKDNLQIK